MPAYKEIDGKLYKVKNRSKKLSMYDMFRGHDNLPIDAFIENVMGIIDDIRDKPNNSNVQACWAPYDGLLIRYRSTETEEERVKRIKDTSQREQAKAQRKLEKAKKDIEDAQAALLIHNRDLEELEVMKNEQKTG